MERVWYLYLAWVAAAAAMGFAISGVFTSLLKLPRAWFVLLHGVSTAALAFAFWRWSAVDAVQLIQLHWGWGLLGAVLVGAFVVRNILSQPASPRSRGLRFVFDVLWVGVVYGTIDALLLSVLPVLATWRAFALLGWTVAWPGKLGVGLLALVASAVVTTAYHLGFAECRGLAIRMPLFGNSVMSLGYLVTNNPLTAVISHIAMHVAGVLRGPARVAQLPPHY